MEPRTAGPRPCVVPVSACTFDPSNKKRNHLCKDHTVHELKGRPAVQGGSMEAAGNRTRQQSPRGSSESRLCVRTSSPALALAWPGLVFSAHRLSIQTDGLTSTKEDWQPTSPAWRRTRGRPTLSDRRPWLPSNSPTNGRRGSQSSLPGQNHFSLESAQGQHSSSPTKAICKVGVVWRGSRHFGGSPESIIQQTVTEVLALTFALL